MEPADASDSGHSFDLQNYVVLFLDVLGQKEEILRFQLVPDDEDLARRTVRETAGIVSMLRDVASTLLDKQDAESEFMKSLPEEERKNLKNLTRSDVMTQVLSDALIFSVPIGSDVWDEHSTAMNGVRWALTVSSWLQLRALASAHALRGGLDIGWGVKLGPSEIYGAAFVHAYHLESNTAEYPRVVCGRELREYLDVVSSQKWESDFGRNAVDVARHCKSYLFDDDDGERAVDFLGESFRAGARLVPGIEDMIHRSYSFAQRELRRFTLQGDEKLTARYGRLATYIENRLPLWNITPRA